MGRIWLCVPLCIWIDIEKNIKRLVMEKTGFFEERPGVKSSTRLNSFILLLAFIGFNFMWLYGGNDLSGNLILFDALMLVGIFAPKHLAKIVEAKVGSIPPKQ